MEHIRLAALFIHVAEYYSVPVTKKVSERDLQCLHDALIVIKQGVSTSKYFSSGVSEGLTAAAILEYQYLTIGLSVGSQDFKTHLLCVQEFIEKTIDHEVVGDEKIRKEVSQFFLLLGREWLREIDGGNQTIHYRS